MSAKESKFVAGQGGSGIRGTAELSGVNMFTKGRAGKRTSAVVSDASISAASKFLAENKEWLERARRP